ncbi:MAG: transposase [Saprospiraceae bacterium]
MKTFYKRKNQPHFQDIGAAFCVTVTCHDAVPRAILEALQEERRQALAEIEANPTLKDKLMARAELHLQFEEKLETLLHADSVQEHPFKKAAAAQIVFDQIKKYDGQYYHLCAACVMSNHIHFLVDFSIQVPVGWDGSFEIEHYVNLDKVVGYIKGGSSYEVNKQTGRTGTLWSYGCYDRYIRSEKHFQHAIRYILNNPVKAKLVKSWEDYPYMYVREAGRE